MRSVFLFLLVCCGKREIEGLVSTKCLVARCFVVCVVVWYFSSARLVNFWVPRYGIARISVLFSTHNGWRKGWWPYWLQGITRQVLSTVVLHPLYADEIEKLIQLAS